MLENARPLPSQPAVEFGLTVQVTQTPQADGQMRIEVESNINAETPHVWVVIGNLLLQGLFAAAREEAKADLEASARLVQPYSGLDGLQALGIKH